jgi:uncharacterized protein
MTAATIALVLGASLVGAFVKSVTGMGYPVLAIPLITLAMGIEDAVVIVAAPNLAMNLLMCAHARDARHESRDLRRLLGWGILGAAAGTFALVRLPEEPLLVVLIVTIAGFVISYLRHPHLQLHPATSRRWAPAVGGTAGVMQGAVGVSGPIVAAWLHGYRLPPQAYVFSITAIFGLSGGVQLILLVAAGELTWERDLVSAAAFLPVLAMIPVGARLRDRLGGRGFEYAVLGILVISGLALVIRLLG